MTVLSEVLQLLEQGKLQSALIKCQNIVNNSPADANAQHLLGLIYAKDGQIQQAIKHFTIAIHLNPYDPIFHNNISNAYKITGQLPLATKHLNEALQLAPNNAESFNNLGSLYYSQGDIKRAIQQFEKAIRLNPNNWEAHYNLANCYIKQDMVLQAIGHYQTVLKLNPAHSNAQLNLAMSYVIINDFVSALPLLEIAVTNNPRHAELQGHLAEAYLNLGQTENALQQYQKAIELDSQRPAWQHNLGVLYLRNGQIEQAKEHFTNAIKLQPDNPTAEHMLAALNASTTSAAPPEYVKQLFDQYASYYNQHMTKSLNYVVPQLLRQALGKFVTSHTNQQYILDLGCGTGLCGVYFRDIARFIVGVDISPTMLLEAKNLGAYDALCCCNIIQTIPGVNQEYFEIVLAADVFVYIGDLAPIFSLIKSALKSNGLILCSVEDNTQNSNFILQPTGRYAHSEAYIASVCEEYGFKIETNEAITPRMHENQPIRGRLFALRKI